MPALLVLTTAPDKSVARRLAGGLVEGRLAACVTVLPGGTSVYRWKGKIEVSKESVLLIKTTAAKYGRLEKYILKTHPYDSPEIVAVRISEGSPDYLKWLHASVS